MDIKELQSMDLKQLAQIAQDLNIQGHRTMKRADLIFQILGARSKQDSQLRTEGTLEIMNEGFGFLRSPDYNYLSGPDDIYVSNSQIKRFGLKNGDTINGLIRPPKDNERFFALLKINTINFVEPDVARRAPNFDNLIPLHPDTRINLEDYQNNFSGRILNLLAPIGKGQRAMIVSQPKTGKTVFLQTITNAITKNHPEIHCIVLLIDERPEEVTDMRRSTKAEVVASTFDEPPDRHVQVAKMVLAKAKRLTEVGKDVVIMLDSLTRLARAHNTVTPHSGKILTGGVDANALHQPKRFFGAARNIEDGGSLTIIATALIDTGSRMDEVIFEEFKGTGNMELALDRRLADKRRYPAIDLVKSSTRKEELLFSPYELQRSWILRNILQEMSLEKAHDFLVDKLRDSKTNSDFLDSMNS